MWWLCGDVMWVVCRQQEQSLFASAPPVVHPDWRPSSEILCITGARRPTARALQFVDFLSVVCCFVAFCRCAPRHFEVVVPK